MSRLDQINHWLERAEEIWERRSTEVRSSSLLFDLVLRRSLLDLRILRAQLGHHHFFAAGVPWFVTLFGRDAAITSIQSLPYSSAVARTTLELLAQYQATDFDPYRDAEPGKVLHELRVG
jgi:glycogen debranching enzyme